MGPRRFGPAPRERPGHLRPSIARHRRAPACRSIDRANLVVQKGAGGGVESMSSTRPLDIQPVKCSDGGISLAFGGARKVVKSCCPRRDRAASRMTVSSSSFGKMWSKHGLHPARAAPGD